MVNRYLEDLSQVYEDEIHDVIDPMQQTRNTIGSSGGNGITGSRSSVLRFDLGSRSNNIGIDNIIFQASSNSPYGTKWGLTMGQGVALTYSFSTPTSTYVSGTSPGLVLDLTANQVTCIRDVMQQYSNISKLTFSEVSDTTTSAGDIRWARSDNRTSVPTAYAFYPGSESGMAGDIWIGNNYYSYQYPVKGNYGYNTFQHELGHAMGLVHPHNSSIPGTVEEDQLKYSIMSYRDFAGDSLNGTETGYYPTSLMLNDVAAIQYLYGVNTSYQTGNNTYSWAANTSVYETIYDAGGNDTIDASNQTQSVVLNLNSGTWSQIGKAFYNGLASVRDCLTIAYTTTIENATGSAYNDTLIGNAVANVLNGRAGADNMQGNGGDDIYYVDNAGDVVTENAGQGTDSVYASVSFALGDNVENLTLTGNTAINGTGNDLNNLITGNAAANLLNGGAGADTLKGMGGDDTYSVDNVADAVIENANEGTDTINANVSYYSLSSNVENLTLTGIAIGGTGNELNNVLIGNANANTLNGGAGNDTLDGGAGSDTLYGGLGDDTYWIDSSRDIVSENANEGIDTVNASLSYRLGANLENLTLIGTSPIEGTGNSLNNTIIGNAAANRLDGDLGADTLKGLGGDDTYAVDSSSDIVVENLNEGIDSVYASSNYTLGANIENLTLTVNASSGTGNELNNVLMGNAYANTLSGGAGNDTLDGGQGSDTLYGGTGNDTYLIDSIDDVIIENTNEGVDTVYSKVNYALSNNLEILILNGGAIYGTGNDLNNTIIGNNFANILSSGAGNDTLDGGWGNDTLYGGTGDDTYLVDSTSDVINENFNEGIDTVSASSSYTLSSNVENLILTGSALINGIGNDLNNSITGNSSSNIINGGTGADTLKGLGGNDSYYIDNAGDVVIENPNEGMDGVHASIDYTLGKNIEYLSLIHEGGAINGTGNELNNTITGNDYVNILQGGAGDDILDGARGGDTLYGGAGDDTYWVYSINDIVIENSAEGIDTVKTSGTSYTLGANIENLTLYGTDKINGIGNILKNTITGNSAANVLDGDAGADILKGLGGDDTYYVDNSGDLIIENANEGIDTINASVTYTLGDNIEKLMLTGTAAINGTGNSLDNTISGNNYDNILNGGAGNDIMGGGVGGRDVLYGGEGDDMLFGYAGGDVLYGGTGDDRYVIFDASASIVEYQNEGTEFVQLASGDITDYKLAENVENVDSWLLGSNVKVTGNDLRNFISLGGGNSIISGGKGNDNLQGGKGSDTYLFNRGDGADQINEIEQSAAIANDIDVLSFGSGITSDQLWFSKDEFYGQMKVGVIGTNDSVTVDSWYASTQTSAKNCHIEQFKTSDGKTLTYDKVDQLVNAMAAFAPPAMGQTTLPSNYQQALAPVIAAAWA